ncbi:MAG: phosphate ABC transporter permease subunit PstC [Actinomycetota bacterium]|nr:phosphate ABC transporter permease subunit PstC [Actinomycetota bacterium]
MSLRATGALRRRQHTERAARIILSAAALLSVVTTILIVFSLLEPTVEFFQVVSFQEFFTTKKWAPLFKPARFGVWPIVTGTLWVTAIAIVIALPTGLGAAFYLSEYARPRVRKVIKPILELLAGVPTIVFGFFALTFVNPELVKRFWPVGNVGAYSALGAGIMTGVMILPIVASLSEDAMSAVPQGLRQGALALGSSKREVCTKVVFPAALSGIVAATVLAVSRAIGETMIAVLASGQRPELSNNPGLGMQTMTGFIGSAGSGDVATGTIGYKTIFAVGTFLFVITFILNLLSIRIVRRFRQVYE